MHESVCPELPWANSSNPTLLHNQWEEKRIAEITAMTIDECSAIFSKALPLTEKERNHRRRTSQRDPPTAPFLKRSRPALSHTGPHRSHPVRRRIAARAPRLPNRLGLVGVTYVLDEPSIGLHPRDNQKLLQTLKHLRDMGNTVIVVEHDEETICEADHIVDLGPLAGQWAARSSSMALRRAACSSSDSLTAPIFQGEKQIPIPKKRRNC